MHEQSSCASAKEQLFLESTSASRFKIFSSVSRFKEYKCAERKQRNWREGFCTLGMSRAAGVGTPGTLQLHPGCPWLGEGESSLEPGLEEQEEEEEEEEEQQVTPPWPFPRAETQAACKAPQNRIFNCNYNTLQSTRLVCRWFFWFLFLPFGVLVVFFSPNISFVAEDYIPNGVFLSAVLYTALLFKELAWILTTLQAGNLVGAVFCCLLIYH